MATRAPVGANKDPIAKVCLSKKIYISLYFVCFPSLSALAWIDTFPKGFLVRFHFFQVFKGFRQPVRIMNKWNDKRNDSLKSDIERIE